MDKIDKFQIVFNNPSATYFAGETVYGYGWLVIKDPVYVSSEYIVLVTHVPVCANLSFLLYSHAANLRPTELPPFVLTAEVP